MVGTAVLELPWAFQQSGIIPGLIFTFTSFLTSFYTCKLVIVMSGTDPDYSDTLRKFWGPIGYYVGLFAPMILILGGITTFFITMNQIIYQMCLALFHLFTNEKVY